MRIEFWFGVIMMVCLLHCSSLAIETLADNIAGADYLCRPVVETSYWTERWTAILFAYRWWCCCSSSQQIANYADCFTSSKHHLWITTSIIVDRLVEVDLAHITLTTRPSKHLIGRMIDFIWYYGPAAPFQCHRVQPTLGGRSFDYYLQLTWSVMCSTFSRHIETIVFPGCILMLCCSDMMLWCPPLSFRRMHVVCIHLYIGSELQHGFIVHAPSTLHPNLSVFYFYQLKISSISPSHTLPPKPHHIVNRQLFTRVGVAQRIWCNNGCCLPPRGREGGDDGGWRIVPCSSLHPHTH